MLNQRSTLLLEVSPRLTDREQLTAGIVHLGLGAFHRGHQALITDETMQLSGERNWGIIAANIRSGVQLVEDLQAQDNLYTVTETNPDGSRIHKLVSSLVDTVFPGDDRRALIEMMSQENIRIVSLTVTEKGYCTNLATGELLLDNPLVEHDIANRDNPRSAIGLIVAALAARREAGIKPFTILSCDNMPDNGKRTRNAVLQLAEQYDPALSQWIAETCTFPCTMVDRIVPAVTENDLAAVKKELGMEDKGAIVCEAFTQWVIEDDFLMGRPDWDKVPGVSFVDDVQPYEEMKLRMLNGSHSFLAYLGYLGNYTTISEVTADPQYFAATRKLMNEVSAPTLDMPAGSDLEAYAEGLLQRFLNPGLAHHTWQVAMDGSQKVPQRWLNTIRFHLENGSSFAPLALGIAAWMQYASGVDMNGEIIDVRDPMADELKAIGDHYANNIEGRIKAFLNISPIFGDELPQNERFVSEVIAAAEQLDKLGARAAVASLVKA